MSDVHSKKVRSYNMSRIRGKNTKPEILVRKYLHENGFRYKLHDKGLPGKPDIVLPKYKTIIEVQGCFWHGHKDCKFFKLPKSKISFWENKISKTVKRDNRNHQLLKRLGWNLIVIWECELKSNSISNTLSPKLLKRITNIIV